jgi:SpoVK/Ycf46/Vps4 family AAA+-type ATPase
MWRALVPKLDGEASGLAARYPIEPAYAAEAVRDVRSFDGGRISSGSISAAIQARSSLSLSGGVQLIKPTASREVLVLHPGRMQQIDEALNRLLYQQRVLDEWGFLRGRPGARGVRMLFAGPPGTGKTLTAEVMAKALSMDLLVVDIARVVSKWIGETEKNLAAVFDTAERARAVLLFDEADALFGKRTEVSDAHDRYANLETAYLLARLERFEGLAVLSTNLRQNIDPAFVRRLEFCVNFDEPGREERTALWNVHLPAGAPIGPDVNTRELASLFPVVGALIRNASVAAGFLAAADGGVICRSHLLHGLRREYEKAGKAFPALPANMSGGRSGTSGRVETKEEAWQ